MNILAIVIPHSNRHTGGYAILSFPLGLAYIIAAIRKHLPEANIRVCDFSTEGITPDRQDIMRGELVNIGRQFKPDYIIYGGMITRFSYLRLLSCLLKEVYPQSKQILGGSAAGSGYRYFKKDSAIDYFVIGEGDIAIIEILKGNSEHSPNVLCKDDEKEPQRQIIKDIDSLPMPSYRDFTTEKYIDNNYHFSGWKFMPMIASRGCPYSCNFCYPNFGNIVRHRNEELVIQEMEYLKSDYNIDSVYFWDEIQFLNKQWMEKFCSKLIDKKVNLKWICVSRASLFQKKDIPLLRLAKKAGCLRIALGIESGNQNILDRMNKKNTVAQIENSIRIIRDAGIKATGSMLAGYLGENLGTIKDSINFANRNLLKTSFYCLIPLPGSSIYDYCVKNLLINDEIDYLETVSMQGGDASHIVINLTDMDEITYKDQVAKANDLVKTIRFGDILKYYGLSRGFMEYLKSCYTSVNLKIKGRMFETL